MTKTRARKVLRELSTKWDIFPWLVNSGSDSPEFARDGTRLSVKKIRVICENEGFFSTALHRIVPDEVLLKGMASQLTFKMSDRAVATYEFLIGQAHLLVTSDLLLGYDAATRDTLIDTWVAMSHAAITFLFSHASTASLYASPDYHLDVVPDGVLISKKKCVLRMMGRKWKQLLKNPEKRWNSGEDSIVPW